MLCGQGGRYGVVRCDIQHIQHLRANIRIVRPPVTSVLCCASGGPKKRLLFLGTPEVAASVLRHIIHEAQQPNACFEVVGVASQPPKPRGRGKTSQPMPSPVEATARDWGGMPDSAILTPATAKDPGFLAQVQAMQPDLCVTAAYGNMLPQAFLAIPTLGTLNIHPSLLPKYRGAAPVQRALQAGARVTGVSVAYSVLACDAGPVLAQQQVPVDADIQAPELMQALFDLGSQLLLCMLPLVWEGRGPALATEQQEEAVVFAPKVAKEEGVLDPANAPSALVLHNTVRALAGWPGTVVRLEAQEGPTGTSEPMTLRVIKTRPPSEADSAVYRALSFSNSQELGWAPNGDLLVPCRGGNGGVLRVEVVQPPTKKVMAAADFRNGVRGRRLHLMQAK